MASVFHTSLGIHEKFDLKGSTKGRRSRPEEAASGLPQKDLNWLERGRALQLRPEDRTRLIRIHARDVEFLQRQGVVDYSVLLGVHDRRKASQGDGGIGATQSVRVSPQGATMAAQVALKMRRRSVLKEKERASAPAPGSSSHVRKMGEAVSSEDGNELYYLGIIDTLMPYDGTRVIQDAFQSVQGFLTGHRGTTHSIVEPGMFRERQAALFQQICGSDTVPCTAERLEGPRAHSRRRILFVGLPIVTAALTAATLSILRNRSKT